MLLALVALYAVLVPDAPEAGVRGLYARLVSARAAGAGSLAKPVKEAVDERATSARAASWSQSEGDALLQGRDR